jgi:hypothetical protein
MFFDSEEVIHHGREGDGNVGWFRRCEGMDHNGGVPGRLTEKNGKKFQHECEWQGHCEQRAKNGYNSGMGEIFRKVAGVADYSVDNSVEGGESEGECMQVHTP